MDVRRASPPRTVTFITAWSAVQCHEVVRRSFQRWPRCTLLWHCVSAASCIIQWSWRHMTSLTAVATVVVGGKLKSRANRTHRRSVTSVPALNHIWPVTGLVPTGRSANRQTTQTFSLIVAYIIRACSGPHPTPPFGDWLLLTFGMQQRFTRHLCSVVIG